MGAVCCAEEAPPDKDRAPADAKTDKGRSVNKQRAKSPGGHPVTGKDDRSPDHQHHHFKQEELKNESGFDLFDDAYKNKDVNKFVDLFLSEQNLDGFQEEMHPWAVPPQSIGCLAVTQLAILASTKPKEIKDEIREAGAIPKLKEFMTKNKGKEDCDHAAVILLSFLVLENEANAKQCFENALLEELIPLLSSGTVQGVRCAACSTVRNICIVSDDYKKRLGEIGGIAGLVEVMVPVSTPVNTDLMIECVLNLLDCLENNMDMPIDENCDKAVAAGLQDKIDGLMKLNDDVLSEVLQDLTDCVNN